MGIVRVAINDAGELSLYFEGEEETVRETLMRFMKQSSRQFEATAPAATDPPQIILKTRLAALEKGDRLLEALAILESNQQP
jgi:hypothetical protein